MVSVLSFSGVLGLSGVVGDADDERLPCSFLAIDFTSFWVWVLISDALAALTTRVMILLNGENTSKRALIALVYAGNKLLITSKLSVASL